MKEFKLDERHKIEPGFIAPEGYFDALSQKVDARIATHEPKVINLRQKTWWYAAAAVLVISLGITWFSALSVTSNTADPAVIENYLVAQADTEDLIIDALGKEDIEKLSAGYNLDDRAIEEVLSGNTHLEQYIID